MNKLKKYIRDKPMCRNAHLSRFELLFMQVFNRQIADENEVIFKQMKHFTKRKRIDTA